MKRERLAWLVSIILLAILAFQLPGTLGQRDDEYAWMRTLVEIHRQILDNYVDPVDDAQLKQKAIEGMLSALDDPYTVYVPHDNEAEFDKELGGTFSGVGISLRQIGGKMVISSPIDGGPADRAGMDAGDIIIKVDGKSIAGLAIDEVVKRVSGPLGSAVTLTVDREGKDLDFTLHRQQIVLPTVKGHDRNGNDSWNYFVSQNPKIAYVRISQFDENTFDELKNVLIGSNGRSGLMAAGMQGLILDLRFNPGGQLQQAINVVNLFIKDGVIVTTRGRNSPEEIDRANPQATTLPYFPMIVLVNDNSASAAEIVAGSLKDNHRALVLGQRTFGKGSVQRVIQLGGDDGTLKLTIAHWYLPSGRLVSRKKDSKDWGVDPQIVVPVDEQVEAGIEDLMERQEAIRYHPATTMPATQPTTEPTDPQYQQALTTIVGLVILDTNKHATTQPATMP
ncbi:MAG TPA: S41 family peptidase [Tepidisphaeraceae bacterium]|jgi:carboxyl-terminal processing protease|nr:S41 family peptidase [Tepidisphaeraceae bacterium]